MKEIYHKIEEKRMAFIEDYKVKQKRAYFFFGGSVLSFFLVGLAQSLNIKFLYFAFFIVSVFLLIWGIMILTDLKRKWETFRKELKIELSNEILTKNFGENYEYHADKKIDFDLIRAAGLVREPDIYIGKDLIIGSHAGINFNVSDVELKELIVIRTRNGTIQKQETYFKGRWYVYQFEKNFEETLKIVENDVGLRKGNMKKYETEMIEFNNKFSIYSSNDKFFYYLINPFLIERLLLLEQHHRGTIYYCFESNKLHIGINDYSNSLYIDIKRKIDENSMEIFNSDIVLIKKIIDEFNLSGDKFKI